MTHANWNYPTAISVGEGCLDSLAEHCKRLNMSSPLLVTDPFLADLDIVRNAISNCQSHGVSVGLFADIQGNPTDSNVNRGIEAFNNGKHDGIVAFGGGSSLDAAKAIALCTKQSLPLWCFEDVGDNWMQADESKIVPVIAIPTTAGTGSEVGRASVITDSQTHVKKIIFHPKMMPVQVLLDPNVTVGLPNHITAATGMDALSHSIEAYCAPGYHPMADGIAVESIKLVKHYLYRAYLDGTDIEARTQLLVASSMGATAFQKGLGAMHALAHTLGGLYDKHHGLLNAILMPYVLEANRDKIEDKMLVLARSLSLQSPSFDAVLEWVLGMRKTLNIPHTLAEIGLDGSDAKRIGELAVLDAAAGGNPILFNAEEYSNLFMHALTGQPMNQPTS
ncbi:iron-containing alcohol dehydrogenase [Vibrio penaeicida]|uniref:Alcohol dehydrogenase n=1 Tax=Vibrio penaeicida TaxID=104609 RepID=A0AAV5NSI3_9VIBR|nr:iron-containing alcohol dehydrogenase [Vibrio penaeicida]RTZ23180.1 iron-containing alcohol dehydrogenase [Vibrio penaeicida]GLQ73586.1 alcohol dehydrogenase [Vibrio penaeicida]